jgi:predicted Zn-dependent protease
VERERCVFVRGFASAALVAVVFMALASVRAEEAKRAESGKGIAFVTVGDLDQPLFDRVAGWLGANYYCPIHRKAHQKRVASTAPEALAAALARLATANDVCLLVLVDTSRELGFRESISISNHVALLNVRALRPAKLDTPAAQEQYGRRVEKESMSLVGRLIGLSPCPMPQCCLSSSDTEQKLDEKGRNLCPPCNIKARGILESKGVRLSFGLPAAPPATPSK